MSDLSVTAAEEGDTPHPATRGRHGPAASRCGPQRDRSLARPRIDRNDPDLPARRHAAKGTRARPRDFVRSRTRPLPAAGSSARFLGEPVIMPPNGPPKIRDPSPLTLFSITTRHNRAVGIISALPRAAVQRLLSNGAPGSRKNSVSLLQCFCRYAMDLPNPEFGSTFLSRNCSSIHSFSPFIRGWLCSWWNANRSTSVIFRALATASLTYTPPSVSRTY